MRHYYKTEIFAVAQRRDGKFLALEESHSTTSPYWVDHPFLAKRIEARRGVRLDKPTHYFESSSRFETWLADHRMVLVELVVDATARVAVAGSEYEPPPMTVEQRFCRDNPFAKLLLSDLD